MQTPKKTVLFFSPYACWAPHMLWEVTLALSLIQRGHRVQFISCSGVPDCGAAPLRLVAAENRCHLCRNISGNELPKLGLSVVPMQKFLDQADEDRLRTWVDGLEVDKLYEANLDGLPLGIWCWPELFNCWHSSEPDLSRPEVVRSYRDFIYGAAVTALAFPRVFDEYRPDALVTLNGAFFLHRTAMEVAIKHGVRAITHERGLQDNTLLLNANAPVWDDGHILKTWNEWKDTSLSIGALRQVEQLLSQRRKGQNMGWIAFSPSHQDLQAVRAAANLPEMPMALLCTSSECEASMAERRGSLSQFEWIEGTIAWFKMNPDYLLVIRVHPAEQDHAPVDDRVVKRYLALRETLPENVRLIMHDEEVSTYSLMDMASVGLTFGSTTGLEMACAGLPVIHAGIGYYRNCGLVWEVTCREDIPRLLAQGFSTPRSMEIQRLAYRFAHRFYFALSVPFTKVKISDDFVNGELCYQFRHELAAGRDTHLDRMIGFILGERELHALPLPLPALSCTDTETRFFQQQRVAGLLAAAHLYPDRVDLLVAAAGGLEEMGLVQDAAAVYQLTLQREPASRAATEGLERVRSAAAA